MDLQVTFLGTSSAVPTPARGLSASLVRHGGVRVLVDCGEGTQRQLRRSTIGVVQADAVLFTHLHADHTLGLLGLVKTWALFGRTTPLPLIGPVGVAAWLAAARPLIGELPFTVEPIEVSPGGIAWRAPGLVVDTFATEHRVASLGYRFTEPPRPGPFDPHTAAALGVPPGPAYGALQRGEPVETAGRTVYPEQVLGAPRPGRRVVFSGDTVPCPATVEAARGADLLVHEATFVESEAELAAHTKHATARQAAQVAAQAGVRLLALTHLSSRIEAAAVAAEAVPMFASTVVPSDLDAVEVPLAERGGPVLLPGAASDTPTGADR